MHGTFFGDFPGFLGFPELVRTLSKPFCKLHTCQSFSNAPLTVDMTEPEEVL